MSNIEGNTNEVLFASFSDADAASNVAVAANTLYRIRVLSYVLNAAGGENDVTLQSAATALSGAMEIANNGTISASSSTGLVQTEVNEALNILMSAATLVAGHLSYVLVEA